MLTRDFGDFEQPLKSRLTVQVSKNDFPIFPKKMLEIAMLTPRSSGARTFAIKWETSREKKSSFHSRCQNVRFGHQTGLPKSQFSMGTSLSFGNPEAGRIYLKVKASRIATFNFINDTNTVTRGNDEILRPKTDTGPTNRDQIWLFSDTVSVRF